MIVASVIVLAVMAVFMFAARGRLAALTVLTTAGCGSLGSWLFAACAILTAAFGGGLFGGLDFFS